MNVEQFRTYINTIRCDIDASAQYIPMEDTFIQIGKGQGSDSDPVYIMEGAEKVCLDSFMEARNNALLWNKTNVDVMVSRPFMISRDVLWYQETV